MYVFQLTKIQNKVSHHHRDLRFGIRIRKQKEKKKQIANIAIDLMSVRRAVRNLSSFPLTIFNRTPHREKLLYTLFRFSGLGVVPYLQKQKKNMLKLNLRARACFHDTKFTWIDMLVNKLASMDLCGRYVRLP
jgi:hypothetical protein